MTAAAPRLLLLAALVALAAGQPGPAGATPPATPPCEQPVVQGRCEALIPRFAFHTESGECEQFSYGGCGANANNFVALADCQAACPSRATAASTAAPTAAPTASQGQAKRDTDALSTTLAPDTSKPAVLPVTVPAPVSCDKSGCPSSAYVAAFYKEIGCTPVFSPASPCCASSYDCSPRTLLSSDKCHYEGAEYSVGEEVPAAKTPKCLVHCACEQGSDTFPRMRCISIECPELFQGPPKEGCVRQFSRDTCCSTSTYCAPKEAEEQLNSTSLAKCELDGDSYVEGQKFFSDKHPCMTCICQPGFNGTVGAPFCEKAACNLELHYGHFLRRSCVPVFYHERCCPIEWRCPENFNLQAVTLPALTGAISPVAPPAGAINVNPVGVLPGAASPIPVNVNPVGVLPAQKQCEFGSRRLSIGESLPAEIAGKCVQCTCAVPPTLTCVKNNEGCSTK